MDQIRYKQKADNQEIVKDLLNPLVREWFFSKFDSFSKPQLFAVSEIHNRQNVLVSAPTGCGKTLTGFIAILNELVERSIRNELEDQVYCVYVSPLKALNADIYKNLIEPLEEIEKLYGKELGIRIAVRTGDTTTTERSKMLKKSPHILITTPESLAILLSSVKFCENLKNVQWFIADEVHSLFENKRGVHLSLSMERLENLCGYMVRIGLSATVSPLEEVAKCLVGTERSCKIIDIEYFKKMDLKVVCPVKDLINSSYEQMQNALYKTINDLVQEHKTTLIFTNTRAGTERVIHKLKDKFPKLYGDDNVAAHHGSLSKEHRTDVESRLKDGKIKVVSCSTSLELGIDIGSINLVICLGSPKSVARALQRMGRSNHKLHGITKGRIIVLDRDDLVECSLLLKSGIEKKIDRIHIPKNALDVLSQQIFGLALEKIWDEEEMFSLIKKSYCYSYLERSDFEEVLKYLAGDFVSLEERYIYAKIWREEGKIGKRGKLARVLYMTNIGTIPDQSGITVKVDGHPIGTIDESFLERLEKGDRFVLGGKTYLFKHARGMVANVSVASDKQPTVPSWFSEMLPLSFDLAMEINRFRRLMLDQFENNINKKEIIDFINDYLYLDDNSAEAIYKYFLEQYAYLKIIPSDKKIIVENYIDEYGNKKVIFHSLFGRRVNDVLSRAIAYAISKTQKKAVTIGINDNGFYLGISKGVQVLKVIDLIKSKELRKIMDKAIDNSEVLKRRFRHCAGRSLMILRNYKGKQKRAGRQQVNSMRLLKTVREISEDFVILKEARREVLEDQMDIINAMSVIQLIEEGKLEFEEIETKIPSPFAFNIALQGVMDIIKLEDRQEFLQRMHNMVLAKISLNNKRDIKELLLSS